MRKIILLFIALVIMMGVSAKKKQKNAGPEVIPVYMYGLSASFNDSTVYLTDVQVVDSAYLIKKSFLGGLTEYTGQMNSYFIKKTGDRRTNAVFFSKDRKKAEKAYLKLRKRYSAGDVKLEMLPIGEFVFKSVVPTVEEQKKLEEPEQKQKKDSKKKKQKKDKDTKKSGK